MDKSQYVERKWNVEEEIEIIYNHILMLIRGRGDRNTTAAVVP